MYVIVVILVVYGLEHSLRLTVRPTVHRQHKHHSSEGTRALRKGDYLEPLSRVLPHGAHVPDPLVIQFPPLGQAGHITNESFAVICRCPGDGRLGVLFGGDITVSKVSGEGVGFN